MQPVTSSRPPDGRPTNRAERRSSARRARRRYAVINQKGGSTKTTTAVNLAAAFIARGWTVRLTDIDPQEGSSTIWLPPLLDVGAGLFEVFEDRMTVDEVTSTTSIPNLYIIPSYPSLRQIEMSRSPGSEVVLRDAMLTSDAPVDIEIFDCPHSMDVLAIAGIAAATDLIIPAQASKLDVVGMGELEKLATRVKKRLNPGLDVAAIVIGRTKGKTTFDNNLLERFRADYPNVVVLPVRDSVRMRQATEKNMTIDQYEPGGGTARDFAELALCLDQRAGVAA